MNCSFTNLIIFFYQVLFWFSVPSFTFSIFLFLVNIFMIRCVIPMFLHISLSLKENACDNVREQASECIAL